jgi:cellulose synthase/poly-beta-1,6-N-acetylglucosamine synthase-like glycosyltransferase
LLSVSIATLNSAQTLRYTLSSIFSNDYPKELFEVVLADGGSTDDTSKIAKEYPVRFLSRPNTSVGFRRNLSVKESKGEIICFTDSDIIVPRDWLRKISDYFQLHPEVDGVGGPLSPSSMSRNEIQKYTGELYFEDQACPKSVTKIDTLEYATLFPTANSAIRKDALISVGWFPESSLLGTIDMPLMWKLVGRGNRLVFLPDLEVVHLGFPTTLMGVAKQQFKWGTNKGILKAEYRFPSPPTLKGYLKRQAYPYLRLSKALLKFLSPSSRPRKKELVRICHYISFNLGEIYGRGIKLED